MMAVTPKNLKKSVVHWALDASMSEFGTPFSEGSSAESSSSTSSLQYINAQLIAHGFTHSPGLLLEGLQQEDSERLVKCLLGMLSQRIEDMTRTEDLSSKIRTLSYEHERLMSMYKTAKDRASNAEREMNTHKARLASFTLTLQNSENAHKRTTAELQRARTLSQGLRAQHIAEIKKIEKDKDRFMERWNKLADSQAKLGSIPSGITFANSQVVEASIVQLRGKGEGFLEISLEQAERSRNELADETRNLRGVVLSAANELQRITYTAHKLSGVEPVTEPPPITSTALFPIGPPNAARDKLNSLLSSTRELAERLAQSHAINQTSSISTASTAQQEHSGKEEVDHNEVSKLQKAIKTLRLELDTAQKQSALYAAQAQDLLDRVSEEQRPAEQQQLRSASTVEEDELLNRKARQVEDDQRKFTEAAVRLAKERAALEAERIRFLEEKRSWQVQKILDEVPPAHPVASTFALPAESEPLPSQEYEAFGDGPSRSPRRSPRKVSHKVRGSGALGKADKKTTRTLRRSSGLSPLSPKKQAKVVPAFETEVIPSSSIPAFKLSMTPTKTQPPPVTSAFVLPPPSPAASFKPQDALLSSAFAHPTSQVNILTKIPATEQNIPMSQSDDIVTRPPLPPIDPLSALPSSSSAPNLGSQDSSANVPNTPLVRHPFPMAKPLASRMIHAYSPMKPSPLSRILMLANSPESPENLEIPSLRSVSEENEISEISPTPGQPLLYGPARSLAAQLGVSDDEDDDTEKDPRQRARKTKLQHAEREAAVKDKGKARADERRTGSSRTRMVPTASQKENKTKRTKSDDDKSKSSSGVVKKMSRGASTSKTSSTTAQPRIVPKVKGGARRVPIDSAESGVVAPAWKG